MQMKTTAEIRAHLSAVLLRAARLLVVGADEHRSVLCLATAGALLDTLGGPEAPGVAEEKEMFVKFSKLAWRHQWLGMNAAYDAILEHMQCVRPRPRRRPRPAACVRAPRRVLSSAMCCGAQVGDG
jgi:hypothetical protein